ncbi:MAG TPA: hypothetical protein VK856_10975 [Anaerolineaceae bacterium]|nr:hypothetical protein [Anaerolineaceae bacterium]
MFKKKPVLIFLLMILLTSLACSLPLTGSDIPAENIEETAAAAVAATLTALAPVDEPPPIVEEETPIAPVVEPTVEDTDMVPVIKSKPDELRVAFVDTHKNLYVWQAGGSPTEIVGSGMASHAVLSPDGEWIVYTTTSSDGLEIELWAIKFDGSDQKLLVSHADFMAMPLHPDFVGSSILTIAPYMIKFIPATHTVVFNTYPQFEGPGLIDSKDLWYIDVDTGELRSFLSPGQAGHFYFSPDGSQMALVTPDRIDLLNTDGSNRRIGVLSYPFVLTYSEYAYHAAPVWAEDGTYLRVSIPPYDSLGDPSALTNIYHLFPDGSPANLLTAVNIAPLEFAVIAPDLSRFAFVEQIGDPTENLYALKISDLSGGSSIEYTTGSIRFGSWAPDSTFFYFNRWSPNEYFIGQVGAPGVILLDANPVMDFDWITSDSFLFLTQFGDTVELRMGTLSTASTVIANLGSGSHYAQYDFVHP